MAKARGKKLVPPANFSRNPMGPSAQENAEFDRRLGQKATTANLIPRGYSPETDPWVKSSSPFVNAGTPQYQGSSFKMGNTVRPTQPVSVDMWGNGQQRRSPSPMTYEDPSNNPNLGMYDLAREIDAIRDRSQSRPQNPMVQGSPSFGVVNPDVESARRLAPMMARDAARQQNTPMNGMTAYEANPFRYNPGDPAIQARQQDNAQRATTGRPVDRTRLNPMAGQINAQADAVASGRGWYLGGQFVGATGTPESARQAQLAGKTEREALRDRGNMNVPQSELDRRDDADVARRERQARHNQFKDANNGMNYRQYDRMQNQNALTMKAVDEGRLSPDAANFRMQTRADKALRRAGNPMLMGTDTSRGLFPDMMAGRGGRAATPNQNPMAAFGMGASNTPAGKVAAAGNVSNMAMTDPNLVALGVDPEAGIGGLHTSLSQQFEADPNLAMDDSSLRSYQMFAQQALTADPDQANPSNFSSFPGSVFAETEGAVTSELWKELATLPDSERARQQWLQKYKDRKKEIEKRQTDYYGSYGS